MNTKTDKALRSFFGAREGGQDRPQEINTPQFIIDGLVRLWPDGISCDPCSNELSAVPAQYRLTITDNGLDYEWPSYTYVNPPYGTLREWLEHSYATETVWLLPIRTNRTWFMSFATKADIVCFLRPFAFVGHKFTFPAPIGLFYFGAQVTLFKQIFKPYGYIGRITEV